MPSVKSKYLHNLKYLIFVIFPFFFCSTFIMSWSKEQVICLIDEYRKYPCLYAVKSKLYSNKHARQEAFEKIESALKSLRSSVTVMEIKVKLAGLRATYISEYKKHVNSLKSGQGSDDVYFPSLWYFKHLHFINDHIEVRQSIDSVNLHESTVDEVEYEVIDEGYRIEEAENDSNIDSIDTKQKQSESTSDLPKSVYSCASAKAPKHKKKKSNDHDYIVEEASNTLKTISKTLQEVNNLGTGSASKDEQTDIYSEDRALANFIVSKLHKIEYPDIRLQLEETITMELFSAIKDCRKRRLDEF
ncbi:unnamed protein product [Phaedon cochleariae]|uniref:MADF domain-containing protein n=1 Tax=Phaedon cochleariae TaxID=80249 RepID=A0A9N9SFQ2_PHACE|nr:unnamed protein product [Phaedon cochleariae]